MIRTLLLLAGLMTGFFVSAGPPENAKKLMIPFPSICTPTMTEMIGALTMDYAVHISMTFEETPITGIVVVHNPDTKTAAVLHVRSDRTCLVFSGLNLKLMSRPEGMAPPQQSIPNSDTES
tara:strand:- start:974 stop:1336 length:363 start_codon:yes stop_codon:yes gene_type:complete